MPRAMPLACAASTTRCQSAARRIPEKLADASPQRTADAAGLRARGLAARLQDYARAFPGIGKARADLVADASTRVAVGNGPPVARPTPRYSDNLRLAITDQSDPRSLHATGCGVALLPLPGQRGRRWRYQATAVLADCLARLLEAAMV